ncbi:hypothetical protein DL764_003026 [Monosporascus ibericus]|uniref:Uncharacterized protein n=1 Tax=Monosporascus ibericus TaxID=155417 RepID=A0A4Q4TM92_9PEZI|nr:hypothetical protein DL764_003026 [Monosporascus ibericus]
MSSVASTSGGLRAFVNSRFYRQILMDDYHDNLGRPTYRLRRLLHVASTLGAPIFMGADNAYLWCKVYEPAIDGPLADVNSLEFEQELDRIHEPFTNPPPFLGSQDMRPDESVKIRHGDLVYWFTKVWYGPEFSWARVMLDAYLGYMQYALENITMRDFLVTPQTYNKALESEYIAIEIATTKRLTPEQEASLVPAREKILEGIHYRVSLDHMGGKPVYFTFRNFRARRR